MRGLKYSYSCIIRYITIVALLVSAWIEILNGFETRVNTCVALLVSAWIEIKQIKDKSFNEYVALLVSAWIEIVSCCSVLQWPRRTPRECVD